MDFFTRGIDPAGVTLRSSPALPRAADGAAVNEAQQAPTAAGPKCAHDPAPHVPALPRPLAATRLPANFFTGLPADFFTRGTVPAGVTQRSQPALPRAADGAVVNAEQQAPVATGLRRAPYPALSSQRLGLPKPSRHIDPYVRALGTPGQLRAARLINSAKSTLRATRNPMLSLRAAGVPAAVGALSGGESAAALALARRLARVEGSKVSSYLQTYARFATTKWPHLAPFPVTHTGLAAYYADYVLVRGLASSSLKRIHTAIKSGARALDIWGLSTSEEADLMETRVYLCTSFPSTVQSGRCFSLQEMSAFYDATPVGSEEGALARALFAVSVGSQARHTEVAHLWLGDLTFTPIGLLIECVLSKGQRDTLVPSPRICPVPPTRFKFLDGQQHLLEYLTRFRGWHATVAGSRATEPVFTRPGGGSLTAPYATQLLRRYLAEAGILAANPQFDMHFGRATGLNFWAHTCFIARPIVETAGGWATSGWSRVVHRHYARRTPSETCSIFRLELTRVCRDLQWQL